MYFVAALVPLLLTFCFSNARRYTCENDVEIDQFCLITRVESESACRMNFPNVTAIKIQFARITDLSARIAYSMRNVLNLEIADGYVRTMHVKPELEFLRVSSCELKQLYIDGRQQNQLVELHLPQNSLDELPQNLNHLENLSMLDLSHNYIEFIDMGQLNNLKFLSIVDFSYNRIKVVFAAETVLLPDLVFLNMKHNSITGMHISNWATQILNELDLSHNQLTSVKNFPQKFPLMVSANFEQNPLTCGWLRETTKLLEANNATFTASLETCVEPYRLYEAGETLKRELETKDLLKATILNIAGNLTEATVDIDSNVDDLFCQILGENNSGY